MVAIVTGSGLGLQSSSALGLGGRGQLGSAGVGKAGEQVFVNAATGNLILHDRDQWLMGRGVDGQILRAYNSQAQLAGENWRPGSSKTVDGLTGAVATAGSTVARTDWDGTRIVYAWDAARSLYVATRGAGTRDTLAWNAASQEWTWTQGGGGLIERYNAIRGGRLIAGRDTDGNTVQYLYNDAGQLAQVSTANGETTYLDYVGGRLAQIRTVTQAASGNATATAVRYAYDAQGRLSTVTLDLSPGDNSVADGKVYTTTYGYDGTSARIASIAQSDGGRVAFTYQLIDGQYRVDSISQTGPDGAIRKTTLSYDLANRRTTIVDPLGQDTILTYDAQGRLLQSSSPQVGGGPRQTQTFTYDAAGQVETIRDGLNNEVKYTYDARGRLQRQEDAAGTVVERTYGTRDELLSETVSGPGSTPATTSYVYDAEQHLRFVITADGRVTEYRYDASGQQTSALTYSTGQYTGADKTEAAVATWLATNARIGERTDTAYDFRGNVSTVTKYATLRGDGEGILDASAIRTRYVYDPQGRLLQRYAGPTATPDVEQFTYDGLGRVLTATAFNDSVTVTQYDDAQRRTVVTLANGLVRTSNYDEAGELLSVTESGPNGAVLSQVKYSYDNNGRLRMTQDALGAKTHYVYDESGRRTAEIDASGALTEYRYDANNQIVQTVRYAKPANTAALLDSQGLPREWVTSGSATVALTLRNSGVLPASDASDRNEWRFYDRAGRLSKTVGADGALVENVYDASSRLLQTKIYGTKVDMVKFAANPTVANAVTVADGQHLDRVTRYFHSADGLLRGTLDANGQLVENIYDGAGRKLRTVAYQTATAADKRASGTLDQLRPASTGNDIARHYFYDSRGLLTQEVDGEGYLTSYEYDSAGHVSRRTRGLKVDPSQMTSPQTVQGNLIVARGVAGSDGEWPKIQVWIDGVNTQTFTINSSQENGYAISAQILANANHRISLVFSNPGAGRELWLNQSVFAGVSYDASGAVIWDAGGTGTAQGTVAVRPSGPQHLTEGGAVRWLVTAQQVLPWIASLPGQLEVTDYQYDLEGRLLSSTERSSSGDVTKNYTYDSQGQLIREQRADRESLIRRDLQGRVIAQLSGEGGEALKALGANPTSQQVEAVWAQWAVRSEYDAAGHRTATIDALGRSTLYYYDTLGRLTHTINAMGEVVEQRYNLFGEVSETVAYAKRITVLSLGQMHGGQVTAAVRDLIAALDDDKASRVKMDYTLTGQIRRRTDSVGAVTEYSYTAQGQVDTMTRWRGLDRALQDQVVRTYLYDALGTNYSYTEDAAGLGIRYGFHADAFGRPVGTSIDGQWRTSQQYDRNGRVVEVFADSTSTSPQRLTYDAFGNVLTRTDREGNRTTYSYSEFNREVTTTTAEGIQTVARYNEHGQVIEIVDGRSQRTVYEYDHDGRLLRTTTPAGTTHSAYDRAGQLIETTDARGVKAVYEYDAVGRILKQVQDPTSLAITTQYEYDAKGQQVRVTDPTGSVTETRYDLNGQRVTVVVDAGEGRLNLTTTFTYDTLGQTLRVTEGAGTSSARVTAYTYDKAGRRVLTTVDPDGLALKTAYSYDRNGNVVMRTEANGGVVRFAYDMGDRLTHTVDATGAVERRSYDKDGRLTGVVAFAKRIELNGVSGSLTAAQIDARVQASAGEDRITRYAYDRDGRMRYTVDALNFVTESVYDASGNVVRRVAYAAALSASAAITVSSITTALNAQGAAAHANDRTSRVLYDAAGRAVFQIDAGGYVTQNTYDANSNLRVRQRYTQAYPSNGAMDIASLTAWATAQAAPQQTRWVVDSANRLSWQIDASGTVTQTLYDAASRRVKQVVYRDSALLSSPSGYTEVDMRAWAAARPAGAGRDVNATTLWFYDRAGRETYVFDAMGYFTERVYDALGNAAKVVRYDGQWPAQFGSAPVNETDTLTSIQVRLNGATGAITQQTFDKAGRLTDAVNALGITTHYERDGLGQVTAEYAAWNTADQVFTQRRYDASGRMIEETRAVGTPIAASTRYAYNAFGQVVSVTDPRGVELAESDTGWALAYRKNLGYVNETGTVLRASELSAAQRAELQARYASRTVYDNAGRVVQSVDALGGTVTRSYNAFGDAVRVVDALGNTGYFYFDALGRVTRQVDPERYLTATEYDFLGNAVKVQRYAGRVPGGGPLDLGTPPAVPAGAVSETIMEYDLLGRLVRTKDAENNTERFTYNAFGQKTQYFNKLGGYVTYRYDLLGRMTEEEYGSVLVWLASNTAGLLTHRYGYDSRGNLVRQTEAVGTREERATVFTYDALDRKKSASTTVAVDGSGVATALETFAYDRRGNLIESINANRQRTATYYDAANRVIGQVAPTGLLTLTDYDRVGNVTRTLAYTQAVALPAGPMVPAAPTGPYRETRHGYDANSRRLESQVIGVTVGRVVRRTEPDGRVVESYDFTPNTKIIERWNYDAAGRVIQYTDGNGGVTRTYYDALGAKAFEIDAENYGVAWKRDAEGNVLEERRYAQKRPDALSVNSTAAALMAGWPLSSDDRITAYSYDKMGRRLSESRLNVAYSRVDDQGRLVDAAGRLIDINGRLLDANGKPIDGTSTVSAATTTYAYDAAGNLVRRTDAVGNNYWWEYDKAGRNTLQARPVMTDYTGKVVFARTEFAYNGLNQIIQETRRGSTTAEDQITAYGYGAGGRMLSRTNALGHTTWFGYDAVGNTTAMSYLRKDSSGTQRTEVITVTYDAVNRETQRVTRDSTGQRSVERRTEYNLFGEVTGRGIGPTGWQEYSEYDLAGRMIKSNAQGGATKVYVYDGNGNATMLLESQTDELRPLAYNDIVRRNDVYQTITEYDGRNQSVSVKQPSMNAPGDRIGLPVREVPGTTVPGQVQVVVGGPSGTNRGPLLDSTSGALTLPPNPDSLPPATFGTSNVVVGSSITYTLQVPDLSGFFGAYDIKLVGRGGWDSNGPTFEGYGASTNSVSVTINGGFEREGGNYKFNVNIGIYAVEKSTGRVIYVGNVHHGGTIRAVQGGGYTYPPMSGQSKLSFPRETNIWLSPDAYRPNVATQIFVRAWGSAGPYTALSVTQDTARGRATADISWLGSGQYEILELAERNDGTLMRRQLYQMQLGSDQWIRGSSPQFAGGFQYNTTGTFVTTPSYTILANLRTRNGIVPDGVTVQYRRAGTNDAWADHKMLGGISHINYKASDVIWETAAEGLSGAYEVMVHLWNGSGQILDTVWVNADLGPSATFYASYANSDNSIRLTGLPPNADEIDVVVSWPGGSRVFASQALSTPGSFQLALPQDVIDSHTTMFAYTLTLTLRDKGTVPPTVYTISGPIEIGPQRNPYAVLNPTASIYSLTLSPNEPDGQVAVLNYRPEGAQSSEFQQVMLLKGPDGKYRWDSLGLDPSKNYEYFYYVYRSLDDARSTDTSRSLRRVNGRLQPTALAPAREAYWEIALPEGSDRIIQRKQSYNAFGEVVSETDGRNNTTRLYYNTLGKLVQKSDPWVRITRQNGFQEWTNPLTQYIYDLAGQLVGYRDANGNLTTQAWNYGTAEPSVAAEWHADGGLKQYLVDVLGNQRVVIDEINRRTDYTYDAGNRLVRIDRPQRSDGRAWDTYSYDELDRRISHTNNVVGRDTTDFSIEGEVSRTVSAEGRITQYSAVWTNQGTADGSYVWKRTTTNANNQTMTDIVNGQGKTIQRTDFGGHLIQYRYNAAGLLIQQGATTYEYYANGLLKRMSDPLQGTKAYYEYDANGNRTFEGFTGKNGQWAFQQSTATYDALNRLVAVNDPRYDITYEYDANGNRIHMASVYKDGLNGQLQTQDYWYQYDAMNRFTVTMGQLRDGRRGTSANDGNAYVHAAGPDGVALSYDYAGQRLSATYASDNHVEGYIYDALGYLQDTTINGIHRARRFNDLAGRVYKYEEYDVNGQTRTSLNREWDKDSLLVKEHDNLTGKGTTMTRLTDGTLSQTKTYGDPTVVTTFYNYVWFDTAKQFEIIVQPKNDAALTWAAGLSKYVYDDYGRLLIAFDQAGGRGFRYQTDGEGRILQRDELIGGHVDANGQVNGATANRHHSYYFFDDRQVGNVGNDGIERIDYARQLAEQQAAAGARNDDRHKRFQPVAGADFDQNYEPINSQYPGAAPGSYIVRSGDTLQSIASALWGDAAMWYLLADANGLGANDPLTPNSVLTVPNKVTNIHNNASTFKPYNAGEAMGDTSPTVPEPPPPPAPSGKKKGCGGFVKLLAVVVAVVATIYTAGVVSAAMAPGAMSASAIGFSTAMGAGMGALSGAASFAVGITAGAVGGAVGSIASQSVLIAGGVQNGFDWKGVALGAIGSAVTAGVAGGALGRINSGLGRAVATGAANSAITQSIAVATGLQDSFDWKGVAISAVAGGVGYGAGQAISKWQSSGAAIWNGVGETAKTGIQRFGSGLAAGVVSAAARGNLSGEVLTSVGLDVLASTIGGAISDGVAGRQARWEGLGTGAMDADAILSGLDDLDPTVGPVTRQVVPLERLNVQVTDIATNMASPDYRLALSEARPASAPVREVDADRLIISRDDWVNTSEQAAYVSEVVQSALTSGVRPPDRRDYLSVREYVEAGMKNPVTLDAVQVRAEPETYTAKIGRDLEEGIGYGVYNASMMNGYARRTGYAAVPWVEQESTRQAEQRFLLGEADKAHANMGREVLSLVGGPAFSVGINLYEGDYRGAAIELGLQAAGAGLGKLGSVAFRSFSGLAKAEEVAYSGYRLGWVKSWDELGVPSSGRYGGNPELLKWDLAGQAGIPKHIDLSKPDNIWGLDGRDLLTHYRLRGFDGAMRPPKAGTSGKAQFFDLEGHPDIAAVQMHPGGGVHEGSYYKFIMRDRSEIKVIDPNNYNPRTIRQGSIFFDSQGQRIILQNNKWIKVD